ncbi:hypothetical protein KP509_35G010000 [Ceratopteris richardii]|uniref:Ubiquitin-like modifier-activating enzyme ATG7 n=1 Tax=Ceratopteris richardii TaxID=49495 RepID=A0A8T2QD49_CERRI|nr:hypothetical protein KP509_35G010000 [Ceratopteris richardii]KAH7282054.1 hypothetical protein KP509_35G010000 [Ceratopteris richardii]KAH7282055.1 hypothetical protein KP509_35G010000 [Ceratopteris richardii]KAH7282056.1 hypothetical protein KP509_35G010000 [Ceratopteris richardii]KAH7282057.1 hypothetical protein KP509_35G010000 [Ceratopteris richardii]
MMSSSSPSLSPEMLKFELWKGSVKEDFWHRLVALKLDVYRLDDKPLEIRGYFAPSLHQNYLQLRYESFHSESNIGSGSATDHGIGSSMQCSVPGTLYNANTKEEFAAFDKRTLMNKEAEKLWNDICSSKAIEDCTLLNRFFVISYADLKKWRFHYWFAFPALVFQPPVTSSGFHPAVEYFNEKEGADVMAACMSWRRSLSRDKPFFLLHMNDNRIDARPIGDWVDCQQGGKVIVAFYDPCQDIRYPGWPLRNLIMLAARHWNTKTLQVLCYRENKGQADLELSLVGDVIIPEYPDLESSSHIPNAVGWERSIQAKGPSKQGPKVIDLAASMDPKRLAQSAADLNLKLMRWRILPTLNIDLLSNTRCLLLGAGTLGCQVARGLMAWGIRHITFVDSGNVAMSNPVRQSLYDFNDCLNGGKPKAEAAAESLRRILPGVRAVGIKLTIPMPGHTVSENEVSDVMETCRQLHNLVNEHDVIFLLTDTRESRWLPTLLCANADKVAINAALGFDTFLVMRHGHGPSVCQLDLEGNSQHAGQGYLEDDRKIRLGCYFCNDVVAPEDSTINRTLDQQCTVTRPGMAPIAAALAVELAINVLHNSLRAAAPADNGSSSDVEPLSALPHQIRGSAANFSQLLFMGTAFSKCTACSPQVVAEYQQNGFEFLKLVFNHPTYLEDLTGLTDLIKSTNEISIDWED